MRIFFTNQTNHRRRPYLLVGLILLCTNSVTACSSTSHTSHSVITDPAGDTEIAASPTPADTTDEEPTTPAPDLTHHWSITSTASDGSSWTTTLTINNLLTGNAITTSTVANLVDICNVDPERDAVLPWSVQTRSTTTGFSITANVDLRIASRYAIGDNPAGTNQSVEYAANGNGNPTCNTLDPNNPNDSNAITLSTTNGPGTSVTHTGILVLTGWASPANPTGDDHFAENVWLGIPDHDATSNGQWTNTAVTGPHVIDLRSQTVDLSSGWYLPTDGLTSPNCTDERVSDSRRAQCAAQQ